MTALASAAPCDRRDRRAQRRSPWRLGELRPPRPRRRARPKRRPHPPSRAPIRLVADVQAFYNASTTFQSDFEQKFWVKAYNTEKSLPRPRDVRQARQDGLGLRRSARATASCPTGPSSRSIEAANKQMYEQPIDKSQYPAALSFLTGTGKLARIVRLRAHVAATR